MVLIALLICMIILLISWILWKDFIAPPFILSIEWILMYIILIFSVGIQSTNEIYYLSFSIGLGFFVLGFVFFAISVPSKDKYNNNYDNLHNIKINTKIIKILILIQFIIVFIITVKLGKSLIVFYENNLWYSLINAEKFGNYESNLIIERLRLYIVILPIVIYSVYELNKSKKHKLYLFITFFISLPVIFTMSRGGMIMFVLSFVFINLIVNDYDNYKVAKYGSLLFLFILLLFIITSFWKFHNIVRFDNDPIGLLQFSLKGYFSTSMLNFVEWIKFPFEYKLGSNTFRFFLAIFKKIGYMVNVGGKLNEFNEFTIGNTTVSSNVHTVLQYYTHDFGLLFAFLIQMILGMFYGFLYKKVKTQSNLNTVFFINIFSLMIYPLFMHFFDDVYFSILSIWLQYYFWIWLLTRKNIILKVD